MYLFPDSVHLLRGGAEELYQDLNAADFYQYNWYIKITDVIVEGPAAKLSNKLLRLQLSSDLCQETVLDKNRAVLVRRQNLAVVSGKFDSGTGADVLACTYRFEDSVFHYVNKPSDVIRLKVQTLDKLGPPLSDMTFCIRLMFFRVHTED